MDVFKQTLEAGYAETVGVMLKQAETTFGIDPNRVIRTLTGNSKFGFGPGNTGRRRSSTPRRSGNTGTSRRSGNGTGTVTGLQLFDWLQQSGPVSRSQIAEYFGVSPATIAKRLAELEKAGQVTSVGSGPTKRWQATSLIAA